MFKKMLLCLEFLFAWGTYRYIFIIFFNLKVIGKRPVESCGMNLDYLKSSPGSVKPINMSFVKYFW